MVDKWAQSVQKMCTIGEVGEKWAQSVQKVGNRLYTCCTLSAHPFPTLVQKKGSIDWLINWSSVFD